MEIEILLATVADIPKLKELIPLSARELSAGYYNPEQIEGAIVHIFGVDTQLISDGTYYIAKCGQEIVGCGGWSKRATLFGGDQMKIASEDNLLDPARDPARIRAFFVHPQWVRRGIGKRIITACEEAARRANFSVMELAATLPGVPLYKAVGYLEVERFEVELPAGLKLPIIKMRKELY